MEEKNEPKIVHLWNMSRHSGSHGFHLYSRIAQRPQRYGNGFGKGSIFDLDDLLIVVSLLLLEPLFFLF
jgi:hypothetical protein